MIKFTEEMIAEEGLNDLLATPEKKFRASIPWDFAAEQGFRIHLEITDKILAELNLYLKQRKSEGIDVNEQPFFCYELHITPSRNSSKLEINSLCQLIANAQQAGIKRLVFNVHLNKDEIASLQGTIASLTRMSIRFPAFDPEEAMALEAKTIQSKPMNRSELTLKPSSTVKIPLTALYLPVNKDVLLKTKLELPREQTPVLFESKYIITDIEPPRKHIGQAQKKKEIAHHEMLQFVNETLLPPPIPLLKHAPFLVKTALFTQPFYAFLEKKLGTYKAWHLWRSAFSALHFFNGKSLMVFMQKISVIESKTPETMSFYHYVVRALSYYYSQKCTHHLLKMANKRQDFEELETLYSAEEEYALSAEVMALLSNTIKEDIHRLLADLFSLPFASKTEAEEDRFRSLLFTVLPEDDSISATEIKVILANIGQNNLFKMVELALADEHGAIGLLKYLYALQKSWGLTGIHDFANTFLTPCPNFSYLVRDTQQQAWQQLLQLSRKEYHWWQQLGLRHAQELGFIAFSRAMAVFQHFLANLDTLKLRSELAIPCPMTENPNMLDVLPQIIKLLQAVDDPKQQMHCLSGLDLSRDDLLETIAQEKYAFISAEMGFNTGFEHKLRQFLLQNNSTYIPYHHYEGKCLFEIGQLGTLCKDLSLPAMQNIYQLQMAISYRYLGLAPQHLSRDDFNSILVAMNLPENFILVEDLEKIALAEPKRANSIQALSNAQYFVSCLLMELIARGCKNAGELKNPGNQQECVSYLNLLIEEAYFCAAECFNIAQNADEKNSKHVVSLIDLMRILQQTSLLAGGKEILKDDRKTLSFDELWTILCYLREGKRLFKALLRSPDRFTFFELQETLLKNRFFFENSHRQLELCVRLLDSFGAFFVEALRQVKQYSLKGEHFISFLYLAEQVLSLPTNTYSAYLIILLNKKHLFYQNIELSKTKLERLWQILQNIPQEKALMCLQILVDYTSTDFTSVGFDKATTILAKVDSNPDTNLAGLMHIIKEEWKRCTYKPSFGMESLVTGNGAYRYMEAGTLQKDYPDLNHCFVKVSVLLAKYGHTKTEESHKLLKLLQQLGKDDREVLLDFILANEVLVDLRKLNQWLEVFYQPANGKVPFDIGYLDNHYPYFCKLQQNPHHEKIIITQIDKWWRHNTGVRQRAAFLQILPQAMQLLLIHAENGDRFGIFTEFLIALTKLYPDTEFIEIATLIKMLLDAITAEVDREVRIITTSLKAMELFMFMNKLLQTVLLQGNEEFIPSLRSVLLPFLQKIDKADSPIFKLVIKLEWANLNLAGIIILLAHPDQKNMDFLSKTEAKSIALIRGCYRALPLPTEALFNKLVSGNLSAEQFVTAFHSDPHLERSKAKLVQQFDLKNLLNYLLRIKDTTPQSIDNNIPLLWIADKVDTINRYGHDYPSQAIAELVAQLHTLQSQYKQQKMVLHLRTIALLRELIYKISKNRYWLAPIPLLGVLVYVHNLLSDVPASSPLMIKLGTEEDKSTLAALLALLNYFSGQAVFLITAKPGQAAAQWRDLYKTLGVDSREITPADYNDGAQWPIKKGIYYITFNNLCSIFQLAQLAGKKIENFSFVINEIDEFLLQHAMEFSLRQNTTAASSHPVVFKALAAFLDERMDTRPNYTLSEVVKFLVEREPQMLALLQDDNFLKILPNYVNAVWQAQSMIVQEHFAITEDWSRNVEPLNGGQKVPSYLGFTDLLQQSLYGWISYRAQQKNQPVSSFNPVTKTACLSSLTAYDVLKNFLLPIDGKLIALGTTSSLGLAGQELHLNYGFQLIKLPKLYRRQYREYPATFVSNFSKQQRGICKLCAKYLDTQRLPRKERAIVIVVKNKQIGIEVAHELILKTKLRAEITQRYDGCTDDELREAEKVMGERNRILIIQGSLVARIISPVLSSARQFIVINTYLGDFREEEHIKRWLSPFNPVYKQRAKGKYLQIYNLADGANNTNTDAKIYPEQYKFAHYFSHYLQAAWQRCYHHIAKVPITVVQEHFYALWAKLKVQPELPDHTKDEILKALSLFLDRVAHCQPQMIAVTNVADSPALIHYNRTVLDFYLHTYSLILNILNESAGKAPEEIASLKDKIEQQQQKFLTNFKIIQTQPQSSKKLKIHETWKPGAQLNAYNKPGKQSYTNYMRHLYFLHTSTAEITENLERAKEEFEQQQKMKKMRLCLFYPQISLYFHLPSNECLESRAKFVPAQLSHVCQHINNLDRIYFIHEPLADWGGRIVVHAHGKDSFSKLQNFLVETYIALDIKESLKFSWQQFIRENKVFTELILDFSSFGLLDKSKAILSNLAHYYDCDVDSLLLKDQFPPKNLMKTLIGKIKERFPEIKTPVVKEVNEKELFYRNNFLPIVEKIPNRVMRETLLNWHQPSYFYRHGGKEKIELYFTANSLEVLWEHGKRKKMLDILAPAITELNKWDEDNYPLIKLQKECLIELGLLLVKQREDAEIIFTGWMKTSYPQDKLTLTPKQLLEKRSGTKGLGFLGTQTPNLTSIIDQLNTALLFYDKQPEVKTVNLGLKIP